MRGNTTAHCPLPTAHCPLPTAHCPLPTAHCPLPTAHCPLPTAHCLLLPPLSKIRLPLLHERVAPLLGFGRLIVELQRAEPHFGDAVDVVAVGVEGELGELERRRAFLEQLLTPLLDLGAELRGRYDFVDQAHGERFLGAILAAQVPDLARLLLTH